MNIAIFGRKGTGKSYYCKEEIVKKSMLPVVVIDTLDEYQKYAIQMKISDDIIFDKFKIRFVPKSELDFIICNRLLTNLKTKEGVVVVIDEIDMWSNPHFIPVEFENNLKFSRHYNLKIYTTVRNPNEINKKITALADKFIIFRITEPKCLDYFKQFDAELPDRILALSKYEHIDYSLRE